MLLGWTSACELVELKSKLFELIEIYNNYSKKLGIHASEEATSSSSVDPDNKESLLERFLALSDTFCELLKSPQHILSDSVENANTQSAGPLQSNRADASSAGHVSASVGPEQI